MRDPTADAAPRKGYRTTTLRKATAEDFKKDAEVTELGYTPLTAPKFAKSGAVVPHTILGEPEDFDNLRKGGGYHSRTGARSRSPNISRLSRRSSRSGRNSRLRRASSRQSITEPSTKSPPPIQGSDQEKSCTLSQEKGRERAKELETT